MNENDNNSKQQMPNYPPPHYRQPKQNNRWWIPVAIIGGILGIGFIIIISVFMSITSVFKDFNFEKEETVTKSNSVLYLNFSGGAQEYTHNNPFAEIFGGSTGGASFFTTLGAIKQAKEDDKIEGIYIKPSSGISMNKAIEINEAIKDFKESGKFVYAYIEVGDENTYFSTLPADSIFMPTEGMLEMNGYGISSMFMKGFFKKIGIEFYTQKFEDFKSAGETMSRNSYSDSAKYQLGILLEQRFEGLLEGIESYRGISKSKSRTIMNTGIYTSDEALRHGYIDAQISETNLKEFMKTKVFGESGDDNSSAFIAQVQTDDETSDNSENTDDNESNEDSDDNSEVIDESNPESTTNKTKAEKKLRLVSPQNYSGHSSGKDVEDKTIAIINTVGAISSGSNSDDPFNDEYAIKSGDVVKYLKDAREDEDIDLIILRIDSPGGSVIASDELWEEIVKTRNVKPVLASMSSVAASGGYYMAMACDTIIAHPQTITGSIGVILSIPNFSGLVNDLDITTDGIKTSEASDFLNVTKPFTEKDKKQLKSLSEGIYHRFVSRVAESRGMSFDETRALAKGRVWTGLDAYDKGLVDALGGLQESINIAKERLGLEREKLVSVVSYPKKKDPFEEFFKNMMGKDEEVKISQGLAQKLGLDPLALMSSWNALPKSFKSNIKYAAELMDISKKEKAMVAMPYLLEIK